MAVAWRAGDSPGAARRLLAELLAPLGWTGDLAHGQAGAPTSPWLDDRGLSVSLSATRGMAACAVLRGGRIGVDVETIDPAVDMMAVADQQFDPLAARLVLTASGPERPDQFFRLWTLLEAGLKALGTGFSRAPSLRLCLAPPSIAGGEPAGLVWQARQVDCGDGWRLSIAMLLAPGARPLIILDATGVNGR